MSRVNSLRVGIRVTKGKQRRKAIEGRGGGGGEKEERAMKSPRWGYVRIISGTIFGGILGFYLMHRAELKYKEMWNERLKKYEEELKMNQSMETHTPSELSGDPLTR